MASLQCAAQGTLCVKGAGGSEKESDLLLLYTQLFWSPLLKTEREEHCIKIDTIK